MSCTGSSTHFGTDPSSWTVEKLKSSTFRPKRNELVVRVLDFMETEELD